MMIDARLIAIIPFKQNFHESLIKDSMTRKYDS